MAATAEEQQMHLTEQITEETIRKGIAADGKEIADNTCLPCQMDFAHYVPISKAYGQHWSQEPVQLTQSSYITSASPVNTKNMSLTELRSPIVTKKIINQNDLHLQS